MKGRTFTLPRATRVVLAVNAGASLAAGVVLFARPAAIPHLVGIELLSAQYFVAYLLAAAEFSIAVLAFWPMVLPSLQVTRQALVVLTVLHAGSGLAGLLAISQGATGPILWNVVLRAVMIVALGWCVTHLREKGEIE